MFKIGVRILLELKWDGKDEALKVAEETRTHLLEFDKNLSFGERNPGNMIVQGDNLKVLKSLLPFYRGQVKCIYIDPPYNTNAAIENYSDNFPHSDWLSLMYPRLEVLRDFLSEDGAIFISIDDTEQAYLKVICDEIFTRKNFVASLVWEKKKKGSFLSKVVTNVKEYILVYCKSDLFGGLIGEINRSTETYPCINPVNSRGIRVIPKGIPSNFREKNYQIEANTRISAGNMDLIYLDKAVIDDGILKDKNIKGGNILTKKILSALPKYDGEKIIYGSACRIEEKFLEENKITFRQIPKELNL